MPPIQDYSIPLEESRIEIGDEVEAIEGAPYGVTHEGWRGVVTGVLDNRYFSAEDINEEFHELDVRYFRVVSVKRNNPSTYATSPVILQIVKGEQ